MARHLLVLAAALLVATEALAITTATSNNSSVHVDPASQAGMFTWLVDRVDHMSQQWFWFRTSATAPESSLDTLSLVTETSAPGLATFGFAGSGLSVVLSYHLFGGTSGSGSRSSTRPCW